MEEAAPGASPLAAAAAADPDGGPGLTELTPLLAAAQRGELDWATVDLARITGEYRRRWQAAGPGGDTRELAEFLVQATRLLHRKAEQALGAMPPPLPPEEPPAEDPGARLAEYRLFKAAAEALIADPLAGPQAFLRVLGVTVEPREQLRVPPERLALAFRAVLERLPELSTVEVTTTYSVPEKVAELQARLQERSPLLFDELFTGARDRLEAIAYFLALLELLARGGAQCRQEGLHAPITVERA
ncbi:MAG TPA: segregation/condensation protein A [Candidatus Dormibacteraeota bacterium]|nr:segregation/condensation protein A [Candidatus Dormibacteraeota bacterium]